MNRARREQPVPANLLRIYCVSGDKAPGGKALPDAIVEAARAAQLGGASVLVAKAGYSRGGFFYDEILSEAFMDRQPVVVEIVDRPERLGEFMPALNSLVNGRRLITLEKATVIYYRPVEKPASSTSA